MRKKILIATHNKGKLEEYKLYLNPIGYKVVSLSDEGIGEVALEQGTSYLEIAQNKALFYSRFSGLPIVAEDSGLEILSWEDFPGIRSNTWNEPLPKSLEFEKNELSFRGLAMKKLASYLKKYKHQ